MGIGNGIFVILEAAYHWGKNRIGRPGTKEKEIGFDTRVSKTASARAAVW